MSTPILPIVTSNPIGWAVLGVAGVLTYKAGKSSGLKGADDVDTPGIGDRTVKGMMKTFYRTKKRVGDAFSKTGEKYSAMWNEAREEINTGS